MLVYNENQAWENVKRPWSYDAGKDEITLIDATPDSPPGITPYFSPEERAIPEIMGWAERYGNYWTEYLEGLEASIPNDTFLQFPPGSSPESMTTEKEYYRVRSDFKYPQFVDGEQVFTFDKPYGGIYKYRPKNTFPSKSAAEAYAEAEEYYNLVGDYPEEGKLVFEKIISWYPVPICGFNAGDWWTPDDDINAYCEFWPGGSPVIIPAYSINMFFLGLLTREIPDPPDASPPDWCQHDLFNHISAGGGSWPQEYAFVIGNFSPSPLERFLIGRYARRRNTYPDCENPLYVWELPQYPLRAGLKANELISKGWARFQAGGPGELNLTVGYYVEWRVFLEIFYRKVKPGSPPKILYRRGGEPYAQLLRGLFAPKPPEPFNQ